MSAPQNRKSSLLELPYELRDNILRNLLYSPQPLEDKLGVHNEESVKSGSRNYKSYDFYPAILRASKQLYREGREILYHKNTAKAFIVWDDVRVNGYIMSITSHISRNDRQEVFRRFARWDITFIIPEKIPKFPAGAPIVFILSVFRHNLNVINIKVRLQLWTGSKDKKYVDFAHSVDLEDLAEQVLRPFAAIRVKQIDFVDGHGRHIEAANGLSRLIISETTAPRVTIYEVWDEMGHFIKHSFAETSKNVVLARYNAVTAALNRWDVNAFRFALREFINYLRHVRGLVPPQHLIDFAKTSPLE